MRNETESSEIPQVIGVDACTDKLKFNSEGTICNHCENCKGDTPQRSGEQLFV
jgi:hypothetical protein